MSRHDITLIGFVVIALAGTAVEVFARHTGKAATLDSVIRQTLHTHSGRIALFSVWAWLGLHFLG